MSGAPSVPDASQPPFLVTAAGVVAVVDNEDNPVSCPGPTSTPLTRSREARLFMLVIHERGGSDDAWRETAFGFGPEDNGRFLGFVVAVVVACVSQARLPSFLGVIGTPSVFIFVGKSGHGTARRRAIRV